VSSGFSHSLIPIPPLLKAQERLFSTSTCSSLTIGKLPSTLLLSPSFLTVHTRSFPLFLPFLFFQDESSHQERGSRDSSWGVLILVFPGTKYASSSNLGILQKISDLIVWFCLFRFSPSCDSQTSSSNRWKEGRLFGLHSLLFSRFCRETHPILQSLCFCSSRYLRKDLLSIC
jgi:hypothetical protein